MEGQQAIWVQVATLGINFTQLIVAVLGALVITGEFGTGMIRSTFAAAPTRIPALVAKALVFGVVTFVRLLRRRRGHRLLAAPLLPNNDINPDFGDPDVWLAFLGGAGYLALIGVLSLGIGTIIRSSAGGIAASLGLILVVPVILQAIAGITQTQWPLDLLTFLPSQAGAQMFAYPTGFPPPPDMIVLEPWQGALVLAGWTAAVFVVGAILLKRRDAYVQVVLHVDRLAPAEDRLGHPHASTVARTSCTRTMRAPFATQNTAAASDPSSRSSCVAVEALADEVLVRERDERRQPERDDLVEPTGQLERVPRVLVEVVPGVDDEALDRDAGRDGAGRRAPGGTRPPRRRRRRTPGAAARRGAARGCA